MSEEKQDPRQTPPPPKPTPPPQGDPQKFNNEPLEKGITSSPRPLAPTTPPKESSK